MPEIRGLYYSSTKRSEIVLLPVSRCAHRQWRMAPLKKPCDTDGSQSEGFANHQYYNRSLIMSFARNRGSRKTITFISYSFQQQRRYHNPNPIKPAARANHQNDDGRTRVRMIITPIKTATIPKRQRRPLRKQSPPALCTPYSIREGRLFYSSLYSQNLCWALISYSLT